MAAEQAPQLKLVDPPVDPPADPMSLARDRMLELGAQEARGMAARRIRRFVKSYVPRVLHPLIPGERGSVAGNVQRAASKWMWGLVSSVVISLIFFAIFGVAVVGFVAVTAFAVVTSM
ncbi:MAG: hypothetical protein R3F59_13850 [Myxococcota bacterium]